MSLANTATRRASSASTTELARQRDLNKYYQLWLDSKSLKAVPADTGPDETRPVRSSHDTTLTALAQLAALRLNAKRGMVSLIDSNTQIILAEATQTVSLIDESRHASGDHIWLGNVSLPRQDCIDEHTFGSITTWKDAQGHDVEIPSFIVNDTLEDDRFKHRPYVTSGTSVRFYAGVPIVTKKGHAIGVYSISDIRPRPGGLTIDEVQFMEDAALVISEHLESVTIANMPRILKWIYQPYGISSGYDWACIGKGFHERYLSFSRGSLRIQVSTEQYRSFYAKWLIFLPLFNYANDQWFAAGFIWGDDFKIGDPDDALPYFKTFGSCIMSEVASMEVLNMNIAKSTFIASISHDLRSPMHGMLGSLEFLEETMTSAYQMSLIGAIETCGKTLLDAIDHLLDHAKINILNTASTDLAPIRGRQARKDTHDVVERLSTNFDMALLLEEVVEAVFAGQTFRKFNLRQHDPVDDAVAEMKSMAIDNSSTTEEQIHAGSVKFSGKVFLILHIQKLESWCLQGSTGGLRRVIMNVVGNAIKYCQKGCIDVSLKAKQVTTSDVEVEISVNDSGIGISQDFLANHLFEAFSQEDPFTPGTGLGLSIASQIVKNMEGQIKIDSEKGVGTNVNITILMKATKSSTYGQDQIVRDAMKTTSGKKICILNPLLTSSSSADGEAGKLEFSIAAFCREWFNMTVLKNKTVDADPDTAIFIYAEPPPIELLVRQHLERKETGNAGKEAALLIICTNLFEAAALRAAGIKDLISLGRIIEVISQPVGVRKLGKVLLQRLQRVEASGQNKAQHMASREPSLPIKSSEPHGRVTDLGWKSSSVIYDQMETGHGPSIDALKWKSERPELRTLDANEDQTRLHPTSGSRGQTNSTIIQHYRTPSGNQTTQPPRVLLVDDNAINLKLLVTFMNKIKLPYAEALNGLEAVTKYKEAEQPFDFVLMDLQMPVIDGLEATRRIREFEQERAQELKPSTIIAITGVGNEDTRVEAMKAGMSQFLTKPVKFKTLQQLLLDG